MEIDEEVNNYSLFKGSVTVLCIWLLKQQEQLQVELKLLWQFTAK